MALTPQDIVRKEFREAFRGYNQAEVDLFLDDVVEEFTRVSEENQKLKVRVAALQQEVARLREGRPDPAPASARSIEEAARLEEEIRGRVRRFLEEQIRLVEAPAESSSPTPPTSPTVQRMQREMAQHAESTSQQAAPAEQEREPFWAGE